MGKMHRINSDCFKMDDSGELTCRFGMSIICKVETGWGQEGDLVSFHYNGQKLSGPVTHVGDIVFMEHDGPRTTWVLGKKPRDPRLSLLWEFGYRSSTRVQVKDRTCREVAYELRKQAFGYAYTDGPSKFNSSWNEGGCFIGDSFSSPTFIKDDNGEVIVALYSGRRFSGNSGFCQWFMAENATLADVKSALLADSSLNKEHPLLQ